MSHIRNARTLEFVDSEGRMITIKSTIEHGNPIVIVFVGEERALELQTNEGGAEHLVSEIREIFNHSMRVAAYLGPKTTMAKAAEVRDWARGGAQG